MYVQNFVVSRGVHERVHEDPVREHICMSSASLNLVLPQSKFVWTTLSSRPQPAITANSAGTSRGEERLQASKMKTCSRKLIFTSFTQNSTTTVVHSILSFRVVLWRFKLLTGRCTSHHAAGRCSSCQCSFRTRHLTAAHDALFEGRKLHRFC